MARIPLGSDAFDFDLIILPRGDYKLELRYTVDGAIVSWPVGTTLALTFPRDNTTWAATIDDATALWAVDKAATSTRLNGETVYLDYVNGTTDRPLGLGRVVRRG